MTARSPGGLGGRVLLAYALPAFVIALPTIPVYIHLPSLYGIHLGLGLATTGLLLLLARLFDSVTDPLIGALSDRFAFRGLSRKPWIAVGAAVAGLGLVQLLNPPASAGGGYLLGWSLLLYAGWTMVAVPYMAWGAELSADYDERIRITAWREGLALFGIAAAGALTAAVTAIGWTEAEATGAIAWAAIALGLLLLPLLLWVVPEGPSRKPSPALPLVTAFRRAAASLLANRPFLRLLAAWFLNGLANGVPAALFFIYLEHGLGADAARRPLFVLAYFLAAIAAIPLWRFCSRRLGKHRTWCLAMMAAAVAFASVPFLAPGSFAAFALVCLVTGVGLGADLVLPPAIQADVIDYHELRSGQPRAGLQFALWGMSTKLALAAAVGLALPALELAGFDPSTPSEAGRDALLVIYALLPVVIKTMAIALVWGFPITAEKHALIRRELRGRRSEPNELEEAAP